jgi:hypothetical protein
MRPTCIVALLAASLLALPGLALADSLPALPDVDSLAPGMGSIPDSADGIVRDYGAGAHAFLAAMQESGNALIGALCGDAIVSSVLGSAADGAAPGLPCL